MSYILNLFNSLYLLTKQINVKELPTQGYFYPIDFTLSIKRASIDDIFFYNFNFVKDNIDILLLEAKRIIRNNIILNEKYKFEDLRSNDLFYIFFEIVKFTMNKEILVVFQNIFGKNSFIEFNSMNFNYFDYKSLDCDYDENTREFIKYGYRFSLPTVGVENSVIDYVINAENYNNDVNFDFFLFFLGNKNKLSYTEINNLLTIFNEDLDINEKNKIKKIKEIIFLAIHYTLKSGNTIIDLESKIDFGQLFI